METIDTQPGPAPEVVIIGDDHPGVQLILDMLQMMKLMTVRTERMVDGDPGDIVFTEGASDPEIFSADFKMRRMPSRLMPELEPMLGFEPTTIRNEPTYGKAARNAIHRRKKR